MTRYEKMRAILEQRSFRWVVTGAAGFIGSHLVETLLSLGQNVTGVDSFLSGRQQNLDEALANAGAPSAFRLIKGDIRDISVCREACEGADFVLHQAALVSVPRSFEEPHLNNSCNVTGFLNMLISARDANVRSFVYASSAAVYGDQPEGPTKEDAPLAPMSPYAVAKRTGELYASVLAHGMNTAGLRYMNAYGPRQDPASPYSGVISIWIEQLLKGQTPVIYGDGKNTRDFVYVEDIVQANILAAMADKNGRPNGGIYNIGTGKSTTLKELFSLISRSVRINSSRAGETVPRYMPPRVGDIRHSLSDITLAMEALGYEPRYDLVHGLERTVRHTCCL